MRSKKESVQITAVFDNRTVEKGFETGYGFACVIKKGGHSILFDTGCSGKVLLSNMRKAGIRPKDIDTVFLSHSHWDHTGGLFDFLKANNDVTVWVPASFSKKFRQEIKNNGAKVREVTGYAKLFEGVHTTGELGGRIKEQSLIVDTAEGPVLMTGCAHPGIVNIAKKVNALSGKKTALLIGGFHLMDNSLPETAKIAASLKMLGVKEVIPFHCTGARQSALLIKEFNSRVRRTGAGLKISL